MAASAMGKDHEGNVLENEAGGAGQDKARGFKGCGDKGSSRQITVLAMD
ncbi:MAG: hypothetical protein HPY71_11480 [Firmicutes bacterium]|nr:hypothetical protein [Bacillota bacterium]